MIEMIVVPLDGSPLAELALPLARTMAERTGAGLGLVRVVSPSAPASAVDDAHAYLNNAAGNLAVPQVRTYVWLGNPAEQIVDRSVTLPGAVVVMTTHGRTGVSRWLYGSVADKVVHAGAIPVLLLRSGTKVPPTLGSILVPLDGSALAETALPFAQELAQTFGATLHLARVAETSALFGMFSGEMAQAASTDAVQRLVDDLIAGAQKYLDGVADRLKGTGLSFDTQVLEGYASDQLLHYAAEVKADLMVMATRGRTGLSRAVLGSVAEQMLKLGDRPLMLVPPQIVQPIPE